MRAHGGLHAEATVGAAMVVTDVLAQDPFGVPLGADDDLVEAFSPKGAYYTFAIRVRLRGSRRGEHALGAEALHPLAEPLSVDRIPIADQEAGCLIVAVADGLDEGLGRELRARCGRDGKLDDFAAAKVENDEGVQDLEARAVTMVNQSHAHVCVR